MTKHKSSTPDGVLYFIGGQLLFEHHNTNGAVVRKCLSPEAARHAFTHQHTDSGWLSPHTIRYGESERGPWLLQRYAPARYRITLEQGMPLQGHEKPLRTLQVWLPGMVFLGSHKDYYLWTYRSWKGNDTVLYHPPVPNVHANGRICFGNTRPPVAAADTIDTAWTLFWESSFNDDLASEKSRQHPNTILTLLATLHRPDDDPLDSYPDDDLKRSSMTIPEIIRQLTPRTTTEH